MSDPSLKSISSQNNYTEILVPASFVVAVVLYLILLKLAGGLVPPGGDTRYYIAIAKSLASGAGFIDPESYNPTAPSIGRPPGWPFIIAAGIWPLPGLDPLLICRTIAAIFHVGTTFVLFDLVNKLSLSSKNSVRCGLAVALLYYFNPNAFYLVAGGWSEPAFVFFAFAACSAALRGNRYFMMAGLLSGVAATIRPNFIAFPVIALSCYAINYSLRELWAHRIRIVLTLFAFFLLPFLWTCRNFLNTGKFPIFVTLGSETLYGSNNDVVANNLEYWGYWVGPNEIPGETPKAELYKHFKMLELYDYYKSKALSWIWTHPQDLPRLILGKLIRAYVPIPWHASIMTGFGALYRALLYLSVLLLWSAWRPALQSPIGIIFGAMLITNLITTIVFYGAPRFTFTIEPILFLALGLACQNHWDKIQRSLGLAPAQSQ